ncbi:MAG: DNA polymerase III subunit alpha [Gemmatimonadetes bacterium]|nr:DNA polymerase III subunit alpha [Gemmatimonadota bacterium]MDA1102904.1 DNA polymerase III subunit alpha [Gemmatimonadota bacterium]
MTIPYVELHCHSGFSFLDGASHPEELAIRAVELGYPALALTDHNGLYGSMEFAHAARRANLQPITGAEITLRGCFPGVEEPEGGHHVTLLAENPTGYAHLCRLISRAHRESERGTPRLGLDSLLELADGLILLTGCSSGPVAAALESSVAQAEELTGRFVSAFGPGSVFVELQDNAVKGDSARNKALGRLAGRLGLGVVATGNVHYHRPERHRLQDVLVSIRNRKTLDGAHGVRRANGLFHLAPPWEMRHRFQSRPEALANTLLIAERCAQFDLTEDLGYEFPNFEGSQRGGALESLAAMCLAKIGELYESGSKEERDAEERLHTELSLVDLHGLAGFFLVYRDIMELAAVVAREVRGQAPRAISGLPAGRGRGSSVSSIICYLIGLSHIDPVKNNLFLGRFLNEALRSVPDIDLDFPRDIREQLILRVYEKYGYEHTGLVCTFPTYRLKSAVREIGKALDLPMGELEKLSKLAEHRSASGLADEIASLPEFKDRADGHLWKLLGDLSEDVAGLPRHISQHVGGMIISSRPLVEIVPLEPAAWEGRVLCQWDKDSCEDAGFIKIDFLALGMLSLVEESIDLIAERSGQAPDLSRIDFEDEVIYDRICSGDTVGLFQIESRAQIQMVRRTRPRNLDDLSVQVAIVRPGPIVGGAVNPYVRRREMLRENPGYEVPYPHPLLKEALGETLGVIIFQDQVLKVCQALANFSDGQAESLRRAMSRKRSKEALASHWEDFRAGAMLNGVDETTSREVFAQVTAFSEFGFPKSHAAAFGLLAYQSAWLRHYYPIEFYVGLFNNQPMGFYSLDALGRDARRNGIKTLLPDINRSRVECTAEGDHLRIGLGFVRGWGTAIAERIVAERERTGPYRSLLDFLRRTPAALKRPSIENLIWVGGFEGFGLTRRELLWQTGLWLGPETDQERTGGRDDHAQTELALDDPYAGLAFPDLEAHDQMIAEYRMLHFSADLHPLALLQDSLPADTVTSDRLPHLEQGSTVRVAGLVTTRQRPGTAKGYVFVLMEDEYGPINVIVKPDIYQRDRTAVRMEPFLVVRGRLQKDGATLNVIAHEVQSLRVPGTPVRRRGLSRSQASELHPSLPDPLDHEADSDPPAPTPFRYLTALRHNAPGIKNFA